MGTILVEQAKEGMRLSNAVTTARGQLLLDAGSVLSAKHLHMFKTWGVYSLEIEGTAEISADLPSEPAWEKEEARLADLFSGVTDDPLMQEIYEIVRQHLAKRYMSQVGGR